MIYKNIEIHNIAELIHNEDGSVSWRRVPSNVHNEMEAPSPDTVAYNSTGVEIRFVMKGDSATIRMSTYEDDPNIISEFHLYRGGLQGGWKDQAIRRLITAEPQDFVITRAENHDRIKEISEQIGYAWDSDVVRIVFDRGRYKIYDVIGDVEPPSKEQRPKKTMLAYGSSLTHGSISLDMAHSWASVTAYNFNMDVRNLGMAGSCFIEPAMAEYIASEGEKGNWDIATFELGANVLGWEDEKIYSRVENIINQVAGRNADKPIFVISPFYHWGEYFNKNDNAKKWRMIIEEIVKRLNYPNVTYINGLDLLGDMKYISADEVHPNIYGVHRVADEITKRIGAVIGMADK